MAAAGGDTIVPTNWGGLIVTAVLVAVVAAATYFGMESMFGHQGGPEQKDELTVQEVFSSSAKREVEAVEPARVLSRAELAATSSSSTDDSNWDSSADDMSSYDAMGSADDWDEEVASDVSEDDWNSGGEDWDTSSNDDWDAQSRSETAAKDSVADMAAETVDTVAETARDVANKVSTAASAAVAAAKDVLTAPSAPVRQRPSAEALRDWWSDGSGDLIVRFAGTLDRGNKASDGIAVMFSEPVSADKADAHMKLVDADGSAVAAGWKSARNPNMLIVDGLDTGRYQLSIDGAMTAQSGASLAKSVTGPVFVY